MKTEIEKIGRVIKHKRTLERCPFCGGTAEAVRWHESGSVTVFIRCKDCDCQTEQHKLTPFVCDEDEGLEIVTRKWNRRA